MQFAKIRKAFNICNTFLRLADVPTGRWQFLLREITSEPIERQQSILVVIAEASQSTRYGTGSVAETAIRDLLTQTPREFLAGSERKEENDNINNNGQQKGSSHGSERKGENDNTNNKGQHRTTNGVPRIARGKKMLSKVVMVVVKKRKRQLKRQHEQHENKKNTPPPPSYTYIYYLCRLCCSYHI